jgi:hypothetical protein
MTPYRETSGSTVDRTEIECARIREAAETRRKLIEEREKTRRERGDGWLFPWFIGGLVFIGLTIAGAVGYSEHLEAQRATCVESVEIVTLGNSQRQCLLGWIESRSVNEGQIEVHCRCDPRPAPSARAP